MQDKLRETGVRGAWYAGRGHELTNEAARIICGDGLVDTTGQASGLALAGRRAARRLSMLRTNPTPAHPAAQEAWVEYRLWTENPLSAGFAFVLAPGSAQEAVNLALVAHGLAEFIGAPGACVLSPRAAASPSLARLPAEEDVWALLHPSAPPLDRSPDGVFERVSAHLGRIVEPLVSEGPEDAKQVVVVVGDSAEPARAARRLGLGLIRVIQVCPFPAHALRAHLEGRSVILVTEADAPARALLSSQLAAVSPAPELLAPGPDLTERMARWLGVDVPAPETSNGRAVTIGLTPRSPYCERLLLDGISRLRAQSGLTIEDTDIHGASAFTLARGGHETRHRLDRLVAFGSTVPRAALDALRDGGSLLIVDSAPTLDASTLEAAEARSLETLQLDPVSIFTEDEARVRASLEGAILAGGSPLFEVAPEDLLSDRADKDAALLGARQTRSMSRAATSRVDPPAARPRMPEPVAAEDHWRASLRHFHLTGEGARSVADVLSVGPLEPLGARALIEAEPEHAHYPLLVRGGTATPLLSVLEAAASGASTSIAERLPLLSRAVAEGLRRTEDGRAGPGLAAGAQLFVDRFDLSAAAKVDLEAELTQLMEALPTEGELVAFTDRTIFDLYAQVVTKARAPARAAWIEEVQRLLDRLTEVLRLDHDLAPEAQSAKSLASSMGSAGALVNPAALASQLPRARGSKRLEPERRSRIERTVATLRSWTAQLEVQPALIVLHDRALPPHDSGRGVRVLQHPDAAIAAVGMFEGLVEPLVEALRALRTARLEVRSEYSPELHDSAIARLSWQGLTDDELFLMPTIAVVEQGHHLRGRGLGAISELILGGRPLQVIVLDRAGDGEPGGFHPGLGYLAVAHREALVLQSSLGLPIHLAAGLQRMAETHRPAVAVVATPSWTEGRWPWLELRAAHASRATPVFVYDPEAGDSWAERFEIDDNPAPARPWSRLEAPYLTSGGEEAILPVELTFAHAAALDPSYRRHFRILPPAAWSDDQLELDDYLRSAEERTAIPFVWVWTTDGRLARAAVTRELAFATRDRLRAWHILQELGGEDNEYARRAEAEAREQAEAQRAKERSAEAAAHEEAVEAARAAGESEAMRKLAYVLMNLDSMPDHAPVPAPLPAAPSMVPESSNPEPSAPVEASLETEEEEEEAGSFNEPYIDTPLCTSCNECTNLNDRMFKYDENKQAFIADAGAGTYQELVAAAEKCPARLIHPGQPRAGDDSVNDEVLARAAPFNR